MKKKIISIIDNHLPIFVNIALLLFLIAQASNGIFDTDLWLHLKTGKLILKNLSVPAIDPYSYTTGATPWINHSWLFQVIAYLTYKFQDINGLVMLQTLLISLAFLALFLIGFRDKRFLIAKFILSILVIYAVHSRFNLRPDILSLFFFAIFLYQLKFSIKNGLIYWLIFWQFLWVNTHGYFFLGPLLILMFIVGELIKRHFKALPGDWAEVCRVNPEDFRRLVKVFVLCLFVLLLNPQFIKGAMYPLIIIKGMISGHANFAFKHVEELTSGFSLKSDIFAGNLQINILILLSVASLWINWRKIDLTHLILFILFVPFGLWAIRNVGFLGFFCYLLIISRLESVDREVSNKIKIGFSPEFGFYFKLIVLGVGLLALARIGYAALFRNYYDFDTYEPKSELSGVIDFRYPKKCVDFILENNLPKNLFNDFNSGAYLVFHVWPKYKVFIDGRTELHSNDFFDKYFKIMQGDKKVFDSVVEEFEINTVMLNNATASISKEVFKMIYQHPKWQLVFFDSRGVVFLKKTPENHRLLKELSVDLTKWKAPSVDILRLSLTRVTPDPYLARARLLDCLDLDEPLISEVNEALKISPTSGSANFYLGKTYFKKKNYKEALRYLRIAYIAGLDKSELRALLAKTYIKLGDKLRGMKFFKAVLKEDPKNTLANEFF